MARRQAREPRLPTRPIAQLKAWRFDAKTERMNAEQRDIFEETFAADQASLEAQILALQALNAAAEVDTVK